VDRPTHRQLKKDVLALLQLPDLDEGIERICRFPFRQVVNPLFAFLYSMDERIHWRAVSAMGAVVARLAAQEIESARVIMRRFIWNLNDESGGIGWGSPQSMGETTALSRVLAREYAPILISYVRPDGNFLEHPDLQPGAVWAVGRLGYARPETVAAAAPYLSAFLESSRPQLRGLAVWAAGAVPLQVNRARLEALRTDRAVFRLYRQGRFADLQIGETARNILATGE
jgi:hypothetical protein